MVPADAFSITSNASVRPVRPAADAPHRQRAALAVFPRGHAQLEAVFVEPADLAHARRAVAVARRIARRGHHRVHAPQRGEPRHETDHLDACLAVREVPVEPRYFVILAIRVVVAVLRAAEFVAGDEHRRAERGKQRREHRARDTRAQVEDRRIVGGAFSAPVRAAVVVAAVAVVLAVGLVVLVRIRHQIGEREAVVRGDEIDRRPGSAPLMVEQVGRAREPRGELRALARIAAPEAPHRVAKAVVPFGEAGRMTAQLIAAGAEIPRFGDQLALCEHRILPQRVEKTRARLEAVILAAERHAEIETKAVDVERGGPVAQRIHDHLHDARMRQVQRVAAAGLVDVVTPVVLPQPVVARVVQAAPRQRRAELVAFARVVVDDVEHDLDAGRVQLPDRDAHFVEPPRRQVRRFRREERGRVVAPVVAQPAVHQRPLLQERMYRQQFDRRHADRQQVIDERRMRQRRERAALRHAQPGAAHRRAAHVRLVDHGAAPRHVRAPVVAPVERLVDDHGLRHRGRRVAAVHRQVRAVRMHAIAEQRVGPAELADQLARVRVEQQLGRVEAMAVLRLVRAIRTKAVHGARMRVRQVAVPHLVGAFGQVEAREFLAAGRVEHAQLDALRMRGKHREVGAKAVPRGAERIAAAGFETGRQGGRHGGIVSVSRAPGVRPGSARGSRAAAGARWPTTTRRARAPPPSRRRRRCRHSCRRTRRHRCSSVRASARARAVRRDSRGAARA
ncbi:hypothetical protein ABID76_006166 [Burkholderia ambifaria]